jgi:phosphate starvation-inducible protein PhoH and related proteins
MSKKFKDSMLFGYRETMTDEQHEMLNLITEPVEVSKVIFVEAEAGSGKTLIATMGAKLRGVTARYIFAPVNEDEQGFLPGDIKEKSEPYVAPLKQALVKINEDPNNAIFDDRLNAFMNSKAWIHAHPHTYERGVNYENETVIIDEAQNFTKAQLRKIITRCHDNTKIIIIGNIKQCDLPDVSDSGLQSYMDHGGNKWFVRHVKLTKNFRGNVARWADEI